MGDKRDLRKWIFPIVVLLALLLMATAISDAKPIHRASKSGEFLPGAEASVRAKCPSGRQKHLLSGGFASDSPWSHDANSTIAAFTSAPTGRRGWKLAAANFAGAPETVTASVLCGKRNPKVRVDRVRDSIPPAGERKLTARCRKGEEAISGGFSASGFMQDPGPEVIAYESRRKGKRKWRVTAYNNSGTVAGDVSAFARCSKRKPGLSTVKVRGEAVDQAPLELKPKCEKGSDLWSGGFVGRYEAFDPFAAVLADRSFADGRGWVSRFVGFQAGGEVTAMAYCRQRG